MIISDFTILPEAELHFKIGYAEINTKEELIFEVAKASD